MNPPSRPPNRSDGALTAREESGGGDSASAQSSRLNDSSSERNPGSTGEGGEGEGGGGGEPESPARCRTKSTVDTLGVFRKRSIFAPPRRSSSGYFSFDGDSLPLSPRPVATADRATQTPSPAGQAMEHALQRMAEARGGGPGTQPRHGSSPSRSSTRQRIAAGDMQAEAVGQELRRIGDDFNTLLLLRRVAGDHGHVIRPIRLPHIPQEPTVLFCIGILLLVIGRMISWHGGMSSHDHSQV